MKAQRQGDFQPERVPSDELDETKSADPGPTNPVDASLSTDTSKKCKLNVYTIHCHAE